MRSQETLSYDWWRAIQAGAEPAQPMDVLFFREELPDGFDESGVCWVRRLSERATRTSDCLGAIS